AGDVTAEEIVQFYISYDKSQVDRPVKELKGFSKVKLKPGESKITTIKLPIKELAYFDPKDNSWHVEKGEYTLLAGPSSAPDSLLSARFEVH
ncbi:MAG: fibronectin type III-like domain-contianing protein, partial [Promethearchaeota archaeon]